MENKLGKEVLVTNVKDYDAWYQDYLGKIGSVVEIIYDYDPDYPLLRVVFVDEKKFEELLFFRQDLNFF